MTSMDVIVSEMTREIEIVHSNTKINQSSVSLSHYNPIPDQSFITRENFSMIWCHHALRYFSRDRHG